VADGGLVNDLDLSITTPGGTTLYPSNGSTYDRANNVVGIDITSAGTGVYTITVGGYNVPHGPQPYALVVSGAGELGQSGGSAEMLIYYFPVILKGYPRSATTSLANGDFEAGPDGSWTEYSAQGWDLILQCSEPPVDCHGGNWMVWLGGDYNETAYISQDVTVPSSSPYLSYYRWTASVDMCGYDYGYVRINGSNVKTYELCDDNDTNGWDYETVNLSSYAGQTVELQFRLTTDSSLNSNWFLDDVAFQTSPSAIDDVSRPPITTPSSSDPSDVRPRQ
jgi:kumamolisin